MRLFDPALVGRAKESFALTSAVEAAAQGRGGAVFIVGEAGIGKTRLVTETAQLAADRGLCVLRGRATASSAQFRPLTEALFSVLRHADPPTHPELDPFRPALSRLIPEWRVERPSGADDSLVVLAEAVLRLLVRLGTEARGCLVVLEDLHDADDDTLAVVEYLVDNLGRAPVILAGTVRTEPGSALELARAAARRRVATVLEPTRLNDDDVRVLVSECLGTMPERVPAAALERLLRDADGVPFHIEELLAGMVGSGSLVRVEGAGGTSAGTAETSDGEWHVRAPLGAQVPATVHASVAARAERLGERGKALLQAAAVMGRHFHASIAATVVGMAETELLACLRTAVDAQLVLPNLEADSYAFRHALTAEALRGALLPDERVRLSRRAAEVIEETFPGLPATWCHLAASLWTAAGHLRRAAELYATAGRRALAQGAVATAISQLEDGLALLENDGAAESSLAVDMAETLLGALVVAGQIERAVALGHRFDAHAAPARRAAVRLRLARAAAAAGRWADGIREIDTVRTLIGDDAAPELTAPVDAVAAQLAFGHPSLDRIAVAEELASRALRAAESIPLPEVACEALEVLGNCARLRDLDEADVLYERALAIAERNELTVWRVRMLYHLGTHDGVRAADAGRLLRARSIALEAGAVVTALDLDCELAVVHLARAEYAQAERRALRAEQNAQRLRLNELRLIALGLRVCVAAHRGDRGKAAELLAIYRELGGRNIDFTAAVLGFGLTFCSLLHENRDRALDEVDRAVRLEQRQHTHYLSFTHGPHLFLATLAGRADWADYEALTRSVRDQAAWNRQFAVLSKAVLCGRSGRHAEAVAAVEEFLVVSAPYPLAQHLGLRLVGQAALTDSWGDPVPWLRKAEEYFHSVSAGPVASACRTLLRGAGARVPRRGQGTTAIPGQLRAVGVTAREFEVLVLVAERLPNKEIGERLFLSPRTVEKHVGSLLTKTGASDRTTLVHRFHDLLGGRTRLGRTDQPS